MATEPQPRIRIFYSKKEKDMKVAWDAGTCRATARYLLTVVLNEEVCAELDRRGFDLSTLRFQIRKKKPILDQLADI